MNMKNAQLTSEDILKKDFKTSMRGYNQVEVDEFLDIIIKDYEFFNKEIMKLRKEVQQLKSQTNYGRERQSNPQLSRQNRPNHQVNYDILKRLSNLEKEVFGKKFVDS